jgi:hypothetical protein
MTVINPCKCRTTAMRLLRGLAKAACNQLDSNRFLDWIISKDDLEGKIETDDQKIHYGIRDKIKNGGPLVDGKFFPIQLADVGTGNSLLRVSAFNERLSKFDLIHRFASCDAQPFGLRFETGAGEHGDRHAFFHAQFTETFEFDDGTCVSIPLPSSVSPRVPAFPLPRAQPFFEVITPIILLNGWNSKNEYGPLDLVDRYSDAFEESQVNDIKKVVASCMSRQMEGSE